MVNYATVQIALLLSFHSLILNQLNQSSKILTSLGRHHDSEAEEQAASTGQSSYEPAIEVTPLLRHKRHKEVNSKRGIGSDKAQDESDQAHVPHNPASLPAHDALCEGVGEVDEQQQVDDDVDTARHHAHVHPRRLHGAEEGHLEAEDDEQQSVGELPRPESVVQGRAHALRGAHAQTHAEQGGEEERHGEREPVDGGGPCVLGAVRPT